MNIEEAKVIIDNFYDDNKDRIKTNKMLNNYLMSNNGLNNFLQECLSQEAWFQTKENLFRCIHFGIYHQINCLACGKEISITQAKSGKKYCSHKCGCSEEAQKKRVKTCLQKYGTVTPLLNLSIQEKSKQTCMEKYGNEMFAGSEQFKEKVKSPFFDKQVQEKSKQTKIKKRGKNYGKVIFESKIKPQMINRNLKNYGVPYLLMSKTFQDKTHDNMEQKYGERYYWKSRNFQHQKRKKCFEKFLKWQDYVIPLFTENEYKGKKQEYRWKCVKCGNEFEQIIYTTGLGVNRVIPRCPVCYPFHKGSIREKEVINFVKTIYQGEIIENDRKLIAPYELDIVIPEKKIAIEFDGLFWHSENNGKDKTYHLNKTKLCEDKDYQLIHIFENEWISQRPIIEDKIKSLFGIYDKRIYARCCEIREIDSKTSNEFLEMNHLQGKDNASIRYGLFYQGELISVMTFGKPRFNKKYDFELIRFASKLGVQVIGGFSKLFKHFERNFPNQSIISYADRRYSKGKVYLKCDFIYKAKSLPNYCWVGHNKIFTRYQCQKHRLKNILGENFNPSLSESENMLFNGYSKIYDCGNLVFVKDGIERAIEDIIAQGMEI